MLIEIELKKAAGTGINSVSLNAVPVGKAVPP